MRFCLLSGVPGLPDAAFGRSPVLGLLSKEIPNVSGPGRRLPFAPVSATAASGGPVRPDTMPPNAAWHGGSARAQCRTSALLLSFMATARTATRKPFVTALDAALGVCTFRAVSSLTCTSEMWAIRSQHCLLAFRGGLQPKTYGTRRVRLFAANRPVIVPKQQRMSGMRVLVSALSSADNVCHLFPTWAGYAHAEV